MTTAQVFASRLNGLPLIDAEGMSIGRVRDVVLLPAAGGEPPRAVGLVAGVQRRNIFVNLNRVAEIAGDGVHLRGGTVDLRRFQRRPEELLASEMSSRSVDGHSVLDVAIASGNGQAGRWDVTDVALGHTRGLRRRTTKVAPWSDCGDLFAGGPVAERLVALRDLHPTDLAHAIGAMPFTARREVTQVLQDKELADLLEEMSEPDQVRLLAHLDPERRADVIEEMQPDDAADLLAHLSPDQREKLLGAMESVEAAEVRRLLRYDAKTAGGLMTSQPIVVEPTVSVAEVLARIRLHHVAVAIAAQVYVCDAPTATPTGRYLGTVGFQRLLREPPASAVGELIEESAFVRPELPESEVAARLAAYNLISVAVCDDAGRLLGAITVDDVVDRLLPAGWRHRSP